MQTYAQPAYQMTIQSNDIVETLMKEDEYTTKQTIAAIEHRIAERKKMEQQNIDDLERMRQRIEESINGVNCGTSYNPNPKTITVKSKLETEMVKIELKKGEEAVNSFRDVERLESEKRKLEEDLRSGNGFALGGMK